MSVLVFLSGLQMLMIGIVGEYLARVFDEVKQRPAWVVSRTLGISTDESGSKPGQVPSFVEHVPAGLGHTPAHPR